MLKFTTQRIRNLTTGRLHTKTGHIYQDLETISGEEGIMTHMLPRVCRAIEPWLRQQLPDARFWNDQYDPSHVGEVELPVPTKDERKAMLDRFLAMPNPLAGKQVVGVLV